MRTKGSVSGSSYATRLSLGHFHSFTNLMRIFDLSLTTAETLAFRETHPVSMDYAWWAWFRVVQPGGRSRIVDAMRVVRP